MPPVHEIKASGGKPQLEWDLMVQAVGKDCQIELESGAVLITPDLRDANSECYGLRSLPRLLQAYCLIDTRWWRKWRHWTGHPDDEIPGSPPSRPGAIDCQRLLDEEGNLLRNVQEVPIPTQH